MLLETDELSADVVHRYERGFDRIAGSSGNGALNVYMMNVDVPRSPPTDKSSMRVSLCDFLSSFYSHSVPCISLSVFPLEPLFYGTMSGTVASFTLCAEIINNVPYV